MMTEPMRIFVQSDIRDDPGEGNAEIIAWIIKNGMDSLCTQVHGFRMDKALYAYRAGIEVIPAREPNVGDATMIGGQLVRVDYSKAVKIGGKGAGDGN